MSLSYLKKEKDKEKYTLEANKINKSNASIAKLQLDEFINRGMFHVFSFIHSTIVKKNKHTLCQTEIAKALGYDLKYVNKCIRALSQINMIRRVKRGTYLPCLYYIHPIFKTKEIKNFLASFKRFKGFTTYFDTPGNFKNDNINTLGYKLTRVRETLGGYDDIFSTKKGEAGEIKKRVTPANKRVTYDIKGTGTLKLSLLLSQFYDPIIRLAYQRYRRYRKNVKHAGRYLLAVCKNICKQFNVDYQYEDSALMVKLSGYDYEDKLLWNDIISPKKEKLGSRMISLLNKKICDQINGSSVFPLRASIFPDRILMSAYSYYFENKKEVEDAGEFIIKICYGIAKKEKLSLDYRSLYSEIKQIGHDPQGRLINGNPKKYLLHPSQLRKFMRRGMGVIEEEFKERRYKSDEESHPDYNYVNPVRDHRSKYGRPSRGAKSIYNHEEHQKRCKEAFELQRQKNLMKNQEPQSTPLNHDHTAGDFKHQESISDYANVKTSTAVNPWVDNLPASVRNFIVNKINEPG